MARQTIQERLIDMVDKMKRTELDVVFVEDFRARWLEEAANAEGMTLGATMKAYDGPELIALDARISGRMGRVLKCEYSVGDTDYFEPEDDNFPIPPALFTLCLAD